VREFECILTCLKTWTQRYIEEESGPGGTAQWMLPFLIHLSMKARTVAIKLDKSKQGEGNQDNCLKKLVEINRELFQKINKEGAAKRAGHVWICCEILRAYFRLGQISQCTFILSAATTTHGRDLGFDYKRDIPKAIAVTFFFYWGKQCVFDQNLKDADEKLTWAFENCPAKSNANRRKILLYLVPCKLRLGVLPKQELLNTYELHVFVDIVRAIREGNLQLFTMKMEENAADFIKMGTYLLMMKLKFMVSRSLIRNVHRELQRRQEAASSKLDLQPFEHVFNWQDGCDQDETACVLSNLLHQGAVKGYLSHEHRKIVFAKVEPFPPPSQWRL